MTGQFIAVLFLARELAHRAHLRVRGKGSYAQHAALGEFYPAIGGFADSLAEAYQGRKLELLEIPLLDNEFPGQPKESLQAQLKWIEDNRFKAFDKADTSLQNIVDEVVALYLSTIYKLEFLE